MNARVEKFIDSLYIAWAIASKDILDVLKNWSTLINLIVIIGLVVFFYWASTVRPWDKRMEVTVYDESNNGLTDLPTELNDGYNFVFTEADSLEDLQRKVRYEALGVVIPPNFEQILASGGEPAITGYILWAFRGQVDELETLYSEKFSELLGQPVNVQIGENFIIPDPYVDTSTVNFHILFATLFIAINLVPALMMEEKRTKTLDALLVSPASEGQVVLGKALAGLFYVLLAGVVFFSLYNVYVTNWALALFAYLLCALFSIGLALALGSLVQSQQHMMFWMVPIIFLLIVPSFFVGEPFLAPGLKAVIAWLPTTALVKIYGFALSSHTPADQFLFSLTVVVASITLLFGIVIWKIRQSDT
jgi:ABC-2 type transport system permease protein